MIRHIVFFKLTGTENEADKREKIVYLKSLFTDLPDKIEQIRSYRVGFNLSRSANAWDLVIDSEFANTGDLDIYRDHPAHREAVKKSASVEKVSAVVDYETDN